MDKKVSEMTLEELAQLAKTPLKEDETLAKLPVIRRFIIQDELENGDYKVPAVLIYDRYKDWCQSNQMQIKGYVAFFKEFKHYFKRVQQRDGIFYILSPKGFDLSPQKLLEAKATFRKRISNGKKPRKKPTKKEET